MATFPPVKLLPNAERKRILGKCGLGDPISPMRRFEMWTDFLFFCCGGGCTRIVTGGAGFVGSHLVDRLMLLGHEVTVIDNFFTGSRTTVSVWAGLGCGWGGEGLGWIVENSVVLIFFSSPHLHVSHT